MEVILLDRIRNLGHLGDKVDVKPGYGRNYLIPQGKAVAATAQNTKLFEERRAELEKKASDALTRAQGRANEVADKTITIVVNAGDEGKLYGSIGTQEIADAYAKMDIEIHKSEISLPTGSIREVGEFDIDLMFHSDVTTTVKLVIEPVQSNHDD